MCVWEKFVEFYSIIKKLVTTAEKANNNNSDDKNHLNAVL